MITSVLEKTGYFLLGLSGGILTATLLYDRELNRAVGEVEEYVPKKDRSEDQSDISEPGKELENVSEKFVEKSQNNKKKSNNFRNNNVNTNYSKMYKTKPDSEISEELVDNIQESTKEDVPSDDEPIEEFSTDNDLVRERVEEWIEIYLDENPQDFVTLIYYQDDMTLCDDREQLISNPEEVVGTVALNRLVDRGPGAENGTIFVRNLKTMINYEVVLDMGAYSETVLGIFEGRLDKGAGGDVKDE